MRKVLVSRGYGAGWTTWNDNKHAEFFMFDKGLVEMAERKAKAEEVEKYCKEKTGLSHICTLGWGSIQIDEIGDDEKVRITEYDGYESLESRDLINWY